MNALPVLFLLLHYVATPFDQKNTNPTVHDNLNSDVLVCKDCFDAEDFFDGNSAINPLLTRSCAVELNNTFGNNTGQNDNSTRIESESISPWKIVGIAGGSLVALVAIISLWKYRKLRAQESSPIVSYRFPGNMQPVRTRIVRVRPRNRVRTEPGEGLFMDCVRREKMLTQHVTIRMTDEKKEKRLFEPFDPRKMLPTIIDDETSNRHIHKRNENQLWVLF